MNGKDDGEGKKEIGQKHFLAELYSSNLYNIFYT